MTPKNYLRPWAPKSPFVSAADDFLGLDRESQDVLLALGRVWRDRAAARALLKVIG